MILQLVLVLLDMSKVTAWKRLAANCRPPDSSLSRSSLECPGKLELGRLELGQLMAGRGGFLQTSREQKRESSLGRISLIGGLSVEVN